MGWGFHPGVRAPGSAGLCVAVLTWAPGNDRDSGEGGGRASLLQGLKTPQPFRPHRGPLSRARPPFADGAAGARGAGQRGPVTVVAPGSKPAARLRACAPAPRPPAPRQHGVRRGPAGLALRPHHTAASPSLAGSAARGAHTPPGTLPPGLTGAGRDEIQHPGRQATATPQPQGDAARPPQRALGCAAPRAAGGSWAASPQGTGEAPPACEALGGAAPAAAGTAERGLGPRPRTHQTRPGTPRSAESVRKTLWGDRPPRHGHHRPRPVAEAPAAARRGPAAPQAPLPRGTWGRRRGRREPSALPPLDRGCRGPARGLVPQFPPWGSGVSATPTPVGGLP